MSHLEFICLFLHSLSHTHTHTLCLSKVVDYILIYPKRLHIHTTRIIEFGVFKYLFPILCYLWFVSVFLLPIWFRKYCIDRAVIYCFSVSVVLSKICHKIVKGIIHFLSLSPQSVAAFIRMNDKAHCWTAFSCLFGQISSKFIVVHVWLCTHVPHIVEHNKTFVFFFSFILFPFHLYTPIRLIYNSRIETIFITILTSSYFDLLWSFNVLLLLLCRWWPF